MIDVVQVNVQWNEIHYIYMFMHACIWNDSSYNFMNRRGIIIIIIIVVVQVLKIKEHD